VGLAVYIDAKHKKLNKDRLAKLLIVLGESLTDYATVPVEELTSNEVQKLITLLLCELKLRGL